MQIKATGLRREILKGHSPSRIRTKKIIKSITLQDGRLIFTEQAPYMYCLDGDFQQGEVL